MFGPLGVAATTGASEESSLTPFQRMDSLRIDVKENENNFVVHADLPGTEKADIQVNMHPDGILSIRASRERSQEDQGETWHRYERSFGRVERSVRLPDTADPDGITAGFENGVLTVNINKRAPPDTGARRIDIA